MGDRFRFAEDHELPGVFHGMIAASLHLEQKPLSAHQPFHNRNLAAQDAPFGGGLRAEQLDDPAVRGNNIGQVFHRGTSTAQPDR
ncbi:MAG: hypothetical protein V4747_09405 [Pseudomonadota bacterium]